VPSAIGSCVTIFSGISSGTISGIFSGIISGIIFSSGGSSFFS